ncbi:MAG: hypothetical protein ACJ79M_05855 [Myxococcales bacterium]
MPTSKPHYPEVTPRNTAETEEQEALERIAAERGGPRQDARREPNELDDPREEEGWTQPESSAQKGAIRDEG